MRTAPGCLALLFFALLLLLFPLFLANAMLLALARLGLTPEASLLAAVGIFLGGAINVPVRRIPREEILELPAVAVFGLGRFLPRPVRRRTYTVIAVNVGGCLIPCGLVAYELVRLAGEGWAALGLTLVAVSVNAAVCWRLARPMPNMGIALRPIWPALAAVLCALLFLPEMAPPVAFTAGVLGPLIGADLLHLGDVKELSTGIASIGGAGTFDGIVLSGLVATLLV